MTRSAALACLYYPSPLGVLKISGNEKAVTAIGFHDKPGGVAAETSAVLHRCAQQLDEYFSGRRIAFSVPLAPEGTDFQKRIWQMVYAIPFGKTVSYLALARAAGNQKLTRAVGGANGANRLPLLIPCHRVVGENGALTGYAGGLWRKKWLLDFERKKVQPALFEINDNFSVSEKI